MNIALKTKILMSGKTQIEIARETGIPEPVLSKVVNGWIDPKVMQKEKLAEVLGCSVGDLFPVSQNTNDKAA
jgi:transcriptional regulator with XRE-family HTH domain